MYIRPVYAAEDGTVDQTQNWDGHTKTGMQSYGNMVRIKHAPYKKHTLQTRYAHLSSYCVKVGQKVKEGEIIGYSGTTGNVYGAHLHFEVILNGKRTNPLTWLGTDYTLATGKEYQFNKGEHSPVSAHECQAASAAELHRWKVALFFTSISVFVVWNMPIAYSNSKSASARR